MRDIRRLFPTDDPVAPDLLIGRSSDVAAVAQRLQEGTHLILAGPRRTGKTTVAQAALRQLEQAGVYTTQVDLFDHDDLASLAQAIARGVLANRGPVAKTLERARGASRGLLDLMSLSVTAKLQAELGGGVEVAFSPGRAHENPNRAFVDALELAQRVGAADSKQVVLFMDEFQDIGSGQQRFGDESTRTKQIRAALQRAPNVTAMFAGSVEHLMRDLFGPTDRALGQFGTFVPLSPIVHEEWVEGIGARYQSLGVTVTDARVLDHLVLLGDGHPRATMLLARETLAVALTAHDQRDILLSDVDAGFSLALEADRLRHEQVVERMRLTKNAHETAVRVARGERPYTGRVPATVHRALRALELQGVVEQHGRGLWTVGDPLLRRYLTG